ncbi:hypothetical protein OsI_37461 [Oryza sativa Indica Group]|uniref:Uncharacterized protein n=1 Tax=Oryza sativa subsp. indica TaxID=39946 RepID=A2ZI20_ORYSI|nr:hypothetical protein OsI_37461 [Oryza sativa Indica Group]
MDLAAGAVDPPPGGGSGVHDGGGGDSGQRLRRRDEPSWIAAATAHPNEGSRGSGPHAAGSSPPGPNLAGKLQGRRPRLHDNGGGGATARQLRLDGVGVDGAGCGAVSGRLDGSGGAGAECRWPTSAARAAAMWLEARPTTLSGPSVRWWAARWRRSSGIDEAGGTLGPDSTGRPASGVAEAAWVSALAEVTGAVAVLSLAALEVGRWRGVGQILEHAQTIQNEYYSFSMYNISDT